MAAASGITAISPKHTSSLATLGTLLIVSTISSYSRNNGLLIWPWRHFHSMMSCTVCPSAANQCHIRISAVKRDQHSIICSQRPLVHSKYVLAVGILFRTRIEKRHSIRETRVTCCYACLIYPAGNNSLATYASDMVPIHSIDFQLWTQ